MPFVRIDVLKHRHTPAALSAMSDVVYEALLDVGALDGDRFQVISEHGESSLIFDRHYLHLRRSEGFVVIQITMNAGRNIMQKRMLFSAIANGLEHRACVRRDDVLISLLEVPKENWSFGDGEAQYAV